MFQTKIPEKIKTRILLFFSPPKIKFFFFQIMLKITVEPDMPQMTI